MTLPFTAAALCLALAAPAAAERPQQKPDDQTTAARQNLPDVSVTAAVKARLTKDRVARNTNIKVETNDGVVTLSGTVPSKADSTRIARLAQETKGVARVDNQLTVSNEPKGTSGTAKDTTIVIKDDMPKIAIKKDKDKVVVKDNGPDVKVKDTTPDVKVKDNGPDVKIKDDTTPAVKKGARKIADAEITTALKTKLMAADDLQADNIDVDVDAGVVTLHGTVPTAAQKARAAKIAHDTAGVKRVVNKLTVKS